MKVLLIRFGAIGDIVLTTAVIRCLKQQLKDIEIHYLLEHQYRTVLETNPYVDKFHFYGQTGVDLDVLTSENFDQVIDLQNDRRSRRIIKSLKKPSTFIDRLHFHQFIFKRLKWNIMPKDAHIVQRYMKTVEHLDIQNDGAGLDYFIPPKEEVTQKDIPASHHFGFVAITAGASYFTKRLPVYKLQELCQAIDHPIVLLGDADDHSRAEAIASVDPIKVYNACGKFSLHETADLIRKSKMVIAHDTGLMHIAAALKKPVISVWGSTTPSLGMTPYYGPGPHVPINPFDAIQVKKLWCRPCTSVGRAQCPQGHFKCMKKMPLEEILKYVNRRLGPTAPPAHPDLPGGKATNTHNPLI
jgi:ADP-heptose:LPS heptosyltransferase